MSRRKAKPRRRTGPTDPKTPPGHLDVGEDTPDRAERPLGKYLILAGIFLAWLAFLIYCAVAGNV